MGRRLTDAERAFREVKERDLQDRLIQAALSAGWMVHHNSDSRRQVVRNGRSFLVGDKWAKGFPDLVLLRGPEMIVWELKREVDSDPTPEQVKWLDAFAAVDGIEVEVIRPSDEERAVRRLMRPRDRRSR